MSDATQLKVICFGALVPFAVLIILFSIRSPYREQKILGRKWFWNDLIFYAILQSIVMAFAIGYFITFLADSAGWGINFVTSWPIPAQIAFFIVTHDFFIYVFHVMLHKSDFLWRFHEAHHSIEDVDFVSGLRSHPFEIGVNQSVEYGAMVLLGAPVEVLVIKGAISLAWGVWIHHNINVKTGFVQYFINGSEMHRWHHHPELMHKNYATKLACWDWIFGTAYNPKDKVCDRYGLDDPQYPGGWVGQFFAFFRSIPKRLRPDLEEQSRS